MCGLSGIFSAAPLDPAAEQPRLSRMRDALRHRGPDGDGIRAFRHAALVHNRLAIIDLDGGAQPMGNAAGNVWIAFNGEIYNFRELRAALPDYPFRTRSDTEVILALYETAGVEGFSRLRGMFAFALWDEARGRGVLARDPMGIKPLFLRERAGEIVFASEAKAILARGGRPRLDLAALHGVMNLRYPPGEATLFEGIAQLAPGEALVWEAGRAVRRSIIPPPVPKTVPLGEALAAAVSRHLVSDVPVGCYLSGGIDSALVAALAKRESAVTTWTLDVGDDPQEAANAAETARLLGLPNAREAFDAGDVIGIHRSLAWHLETPKVNALQSALLAAFTARHVKVALSGLGGDELFFGYNAYRILWLLGLASRAVPGPLRRGAARMAAPAGGDVLAWTELRRAGIMLGAAPHWARAYGVLRNVWDSPEARHAVYGERLLDAALPDTFSWLDERFPAGADPARAARDFELGNKMVNDLLWHEDRVSMRVGLEVRVPFLDWDLAAAARAQPREALMPRGRLKYALRREAGRVLPRAVVGRPKSGFQMDIAAAAAGLLKPFLDEYLGPDRIARHRLFNPGFVAAVRARPPSAALRWHWFLLYLMAQAHLLAEVFDAD